jgi:hypothetical protein
MKNARARWTPSTTSPTSTPTTPPATRVIRVPGGRPAPSVPATAETETETPRSPTVCRGEEVRTGRRQGSRVREASSMLPAEKDTDLFCCCGSGQSSVNSHGRRRRKDR